jgi:hypothetical protein
MQCRIASPDVAIVVRIWQQHQRPARRVLST